MLLFLLLAFDGIAPAYADRCSTIPPSFWCSNREIIKECGFKDKCDRYHKATYNQRINITVLMEALCPDCQEWIVKTLYPTVFKNFSEFVNIELVPYGNVKIVNGSVECQHGPEECSINRFESCIIEFMPSQSEHIPLIYCIENLLMSDVAFKEASTTCFQSLSVSDDIQKRIQSCQDSKLGRSLEKKAAEKTASRFDADIGQPAQHVIRSYASVWPDKHTEVPWLVINGVSLANYQSMQTHLPQLLCEWYDGDKKIPFCHPEEEQE